MTRKYFGTDGIRGHVGVAPMTAEFVLRLGWAAGRVLGGQGQQVLIGKDTRRSGYLFESALEAGFAAAGMDVGLLGPLPTPGVAYLTRVLGARAGVVISASHNPHHDNGVKIFGADGGKLSDDAERSIEAMLEQPIEYAAPEKLGAARRVGDALERYVTFCASTYTGPSLAGLRIVLDCAHGAAYRAAPAVLEHLGVRAQVIGAAPDGFNINDGVGSTHLGALRDAVLAARADLGIALDGDGDRCLMVDAAGNEVDGDQLLWVIVSSRLANGGLRGPVVGTQMTNLGLEQALRGAGLAFERTKVGDRYVLERLLATGGVLGGETSGHILCLDRATTGDGIVSALQVLAALAASGRSLADAVSGMHRLPQVLINVRIDRRLPPPHETAGVQQAVRDAEAALGRSGRVLLRPSGTEPLVRVMVEAEDGALGRRLAESIAAAVRSAAGLSPSP